ncbi:MAG: LamG domain-containing protein [Candidatus Latescibacterota bacterium]
MELTLRAPGAEVDLAGAGFDPARGLTVEAWGHTPESRAEAMQVLVAQWEFRPHVGGFATHDAGQTDGLMTRGFFGGVFDGRHVYFAPQHDGVQRHGKVLRLDTHHRFTDPAAWAARDAQGTGGLDTRGYYGAAFDGRFVYFVPRTDGTRYHTRLLRLDARGDFHDAASWAAHDVGHAISYQSAAFDGRYLYLAPGYEQHRGETGKVLRYDTQGGLDDPARYVLYDAGGTAGLAARCYDGAVFDGRHVYFAPLKPGGVALRCDVRADFAAPGTWEACDASARGLGPCVGAVFDGRFVYYVPYAHSTVVRFDTLGPLTDPVAWTARDVERTSGLRTVGYDGAVFDGRYVYFIPFWEGEDTSRGFHCRLLRYDTQGDFADPASWEAADGAPNPGGFNGGAFDGRFLYCAPWRLGSTPDGGIVSHGQVLRCDTAGPQAAFALKYMDCGHNGGLGAALPGPTFTVNTAEGPASARAHRNPGSGWHHVAGTYDGGEVRLYVDGALAGCSPGRGPLNRSGRPVAVGSFPGGSSAFAGTIRGLRLTDRARPAAALEAVCRALEER